MRKRVNKSNSGHSPRRVFAKTERESRHALGVGTHLVNTTRSCRYGSDWWRFVSPIHCAREGCREVALFQSFLNDSNENYEIKREKPKNFT